MVKRYGIHTLPMYLMFFNAKLVYAGMLVRVVLVLVLGLPRLLLVCACYQLLTTLSSALLQGGAKFRMPKLDRSVNYLLLEPDARSQMAAEKVGLPCVQGCV